MKKPLTVLSLLVAGAAAACADAEKIQLSYNNSWNYIWDDSSWLVAKNASMETPETHSGTYGNSHERNVLYMGYDFSYESGVQYAVQSSTATVVDFSTLNNGWIPKTSAYVGKGVTITNLMGVGSGTNTTWYFADLGDGTAPIFTLSASASSFHFDGSLTLAGNLVLAEESFSRTILSAEIGRTSGSLNLGDITAVDAQGNALAFAAADSENVGKAGYYWLTTSTVDNVTTYTLNARAVSTAVIPEPATATLSLLALAGLAARRRRK